MCTWNLKLKGVITLSRLPFPVPGSKVGIFFYTFSPSILSLCVPSGWCPWLCQAPGLCRTTAVGELGGLASAPGPHTEKQIIELNCPLSFLLVCVAGLSGRKYTHSLPVRRPLFLTSFNAWMHADVASFFWKLFFHHTGNGKDTLNILLIRRQVIQQY